MSGDPNLVTSSYSGIVTDEGITVRLEIYRLEHESDWTLEVINDAGTSIVWDYQFGSADAAHEAFLKVVDEEGMETFSR